MYCKPPLAPGCTHSPPLNTVLGAAALAVLGLLFTGAIHAAERAQSYTIEVPVVAATPVVESRTVERPERVCAPVQRVQANRYRSNGYTDNQGYRGDYYGRRNTPNNRYESRGNNRRSGGLGAQLLGGLIGGAIGNQFGGGNGRRALTITGALLGSAIARDTQTSGYRSERSYRDNGYQSRYEPEYELEYEPEYECRTTTHLRTTEVVVGYDVTYRYNNQLGTRRMDHAPGDTIELRVQAVPDVATNTVFVPSPASVPSASANAEALPAAGHSRRTL